MKKEEEFLTSCIEGSFRPLFSGVREFDASKFYLLGGIRKTSAPETGGSLAA
jgi:hypothetical protein